MKTGSLAVALLFLVGFLGAGCATVDRLNTEYEEEMTRIENMTPEEKAEFEKAQHEEEKLEWDLADSDE